MPYRTVHSHYPRVQAKSPKTKRPPESEGVNDKNKKRRRFCGKAIIQRIGNKTRREIKGATEGPIESSRRHCPGVGGG